MDLAGNTGTGSASDTWVLLTTAARRPDGPGDLAEHRRLSRPDRHRLGHAHRHALRTGPGRRCDGRQHRPGVRERHRHHVLDRAQPPRRREPARRSRPTTPRATSRRAATFNVFVDETPPTISSVAAVTPNPRNTPVDSVDVTFSKAINPGTFTTADLSLTDNGGPNLITSAVTISLVSGTTSTYEIGGLSGLTTAEGTYMLTVNASGIQDQAGNFGTGSMSTSWLMDTTPPTSTVGSLPAQTTSTSFLVSASGTDPNGSNGSTPSGIASFAIYVSNDGGAFTPLRHRHARQSLRPLHRPARAYLRLLQRRDRRRGQRPADADRGPADRPDPPHRQSGGDRHGRHAGYGHRQLSGSRPRSRPPSPPPTARRRTAPCSSWSTAWPTAARCR